MLLILFLKTIEVKGTRVEVEYDMADQTGGGVGIGHHQMQVEFADTCPESTASLGPL